MNKAGEPVQAFFNAFSKGDVAGLMSSLHDDVTIIAGGKVLTPVYGTFHGHEGAGAFLSGLAHHFDTKAFSVATIVGEGDTAFASGQFVHHVKTTGKDFNSDWVLKCKIKDGKIYHYHFFEDTAGAVEAFA